MSVKAFIVELLINKPLLNAVSNETNKDVCMYTWKIYSSRYLDTLLYKLELDWICIALADPRGAPGTRAPPWGSKFFHFHAVFGKKLKNNSTFGSWCPPRGKSWIRHCIGNAVVYIQRNNGRERWDCSQMYNWHCRVNRITMKWEPVNLWANVWIVIALFTSRLTPVSVNGNLCWLLITQTARETCECHSCN